MVDQMRGRRAARGWLGGSLRFALALPLAVAMIAPFIYMIVAGLPGAEQALRSSIGHFAMNSAIFSLAVVAGQVVTSATAAYAFARLRFPGRDRLFLAYLAVLAVPVILLVIPRFLMIDALGWIDSYAGLISTELVSISGIFFLRQCFQAMPRDLEDAARLEGAGEWTIFRRVVVPQAAPALTTLGVLAFAEQWRSFLWPLVAVRSSDMQVVEAGIAGLRGARELSGPDPMAGALVAALPLLILCLFGPKFFIRGIRIPAGLR
ncbi:MAG TPA: carbohydrate ABC transporter permease [Gemmatimonadales bacterium]|nr:carbohydrate ABC transporter permease [Gemmatimonadales bacterium]